MAATGTMRFRWVLVIGVALAAAWAALAPAGARAAGTANAAVVDVCRFLPFSANPAVPGASKTVFAVRVTNVGGTASEGPLLAAIGHNAPGQQKSGGAPVTAGPVAPGQTVRFKLADDRFYPGVELRVFATFDPRTNPAEPGSGDNVAVFGDPWAVPAC